MNLTMLIIQGDHEYEKLHNVEEKKIIRIQSFYVCEIFLACLSKIDIDGNNKLTIFFKKKPEDE
ncbi:MAG: hypothetical protein IJP31_08450 [Lachnospiraceae bacterium]|nr:hypothetical protein [Lachnospiraceae bacterium]